MQSQKDSKKVNAGDMVVVFCAAIKIIALYTLTILIVLFSFLVAAVSYSTAHKAMHIEFQWAFSLLLLTLSSTWPRPRVLIRRATISH